MSQRRGGIIQIIADGQMLDAKGHFTCNLGGLKRTAILGSNGQVHGFKEETIVPFLEGTITDRGTLQATSLSLAALAASDDITVTLKLANGKVVVLGNAWFAGEPEVNTEEGEIKVRWEGKVAKEVS
jgi:hypothetical protein